MSFAIEWSATVPGDGHHLMEVDPDRNQIYVGDGWGVAYASLSLRILSLIDGAELARVRTRHQQARAITFVGQDALVSTDSRMFQLSRADLVDRRAWDTRVPRYTDTLAHKSGKVFMANWLRPSAAVFDLETGRISRLRLEPGLRALHKGTDLLVYALRSGVLRSLDLDTKKLRVLIQGEPGRWATIAADRWLAVLKVGWRKTASSGVESPPRWASEVVLYDLVDGGVRTFPLSRPTVVIEGAADSPLLWLAQRGVGPSELPSIIEVVELPALRRVQMVTAPAGFGVAHMSPSKSLAVFAAPRYKENRAILSFARVT